MPSGTYTFTMYRISGSANSTFTVTDTFTVTVFDEDDNFLSSKSKLPHHVKSAKDPDDHDSVDIPRLRNALARFGQTDFSGFPDGTKTRSRAHLERHADALLASRRYEEEKKDPQFERQLELLSMDMVDFRNGKYSLIAERIQNET